MSISNRPPIQFSGLTGWKD